jgi:uncharacterized protein YbaP (TraB family)
MNFIEKWNNLPEGKYFNLNFDCVPKIMRTKISDIFEEAIKNMPLKYSPSEIRKAVKKINERVLEKYSKTGIKRIDFCILRWINPSLTNAYDKLLEEFAKLYVKEFRRSNRNCNSIFSEIERLKYLNNRGFSYKFYECLYKAAVENIKNCKEFNKNGFLYKITNKEGVESYLIGTCHLGNEYMYKSFLPIIEKSKKLFLETEIITEKTYKIFLEKFKEAVIKKGSKIIFTKDCYIMDLALYIYAREKNIEIVALDSFIDSLIVFALGVIPLIILFIKAIFLRSICQRQDLIKDIEAWQDGRESEIKKAFEEIKKTISGNFVLNSRNKKWLNGTKEKDGLIKILKEAKETVAIAVGTLHLFGEKSGLIENFKKNGLTVERIIEPIQKNIKCIT